MSDELATITNEEGILSQRPFNFNKGQFWTSLDLNNPKDAVSLIKIRQAGGRTAKECINIPLLVTHIMRRWGSQVDDDSGEVREYIGTSFLTESGEVISSGSIGIERDIESLFAITLLPPWKPPLKIAFELFKSKKGRDMVKIVFDWDDLEKRLKNKGKR